MSLSQTKVNDINLNDRLQMKDDTENEIVCSLFPFIYGLRIVGTGGIVSVQLADVYLLLNLYCRVQLPSGSSSLSITIIIVN